MAEKANKEQIFDEIKEIAVDQTEFDFFFHNYYLI